MRLAWELPAATAAVLLLAASLMWLIASEREPVLTPGSGRAGGVLASATVRMPGIGGIELFDVNDANPFVPWHERGRGQVKPPGPVLPPPGQKPEIPVPPVPPRQLPPPTTGGGDAPRPLGFVRSSGKTAGLQVTLPGENRPRLMKPGEKAGRWTFTAIEDGNVALFADETGRAYRLVIGGR